MTDIKTACPLDCWDACSLIASVDHGKVTQVQGDAEHPVTKGTMCSRGRRLLSRTYSEQRIRTPRKRINGKWEEVSWGQAIAEISGKIEDVIRTNGHHAVLHAYDWGSGTLLKNLNQRFFYQLGGCTETVGSLCWDAGLVAQNYDFGQARSHDPSDILHAQRIVVWGRNLAVTNMHMVPFIREAVAAGAEVTVINPLPTDLDAKAELVVRPKPGTDGALALGVLRICRDNGWLDDNFLHQHSIGFQTFSDYLNQFSLDFVTEETDVPREQIHRLADLYGRHRPVATLLGVGLQRYAGGGNAIRAIDALAAATGQIGISGGGVNYANRQMTEFLDEEALTGRNGANVREFFRGSQAEEIITADPQIEMMFVTRTNPVSQVPNTALLKEAYSKIPFIVVVDTMMTATAELADYFLPCTTVFEEEDISLSTMWHPYVTFANRAIDPLGEAKPDHEIFALLADRLGFGEDMRRPLDEWFELALRPLQKHQVGLQQLRQLGTVRIPLAEVPWQDKVFRTPSGRYEFTSKKAEMEGTSAYPTYIAPLESHAASKLDGRKFPYALLTVHPRLSENSQHREWPNLPHRPVAEITHAIAKETGLSTGDGAILSTPYGELAVYIKVSTGGHPFTVQLESGWWSTEATVNQLTPTTRADLGRQTAQYDVPCHVRREA